MKFKVTMKEMKEGYYRIIGAGYCELQFLLNYHSPIACSCSKAYGWRCDYYEIDGVLISTGYSHLENKNTKADYDLIRKYDDAARGKSAEEREKLLKEFIEIVVS